MSGDDPSVEAFERRRIRFRALAEKYRGLAATKQNHEIADSYTKLAVGYDGVAEGFAKLAQQARYIPIEGSLMSDVRQMGERRRNKPSI